MAYLLPHGIPTPPPIFYSSSLRLDFNFVSHFRVLFCELVHTDKLFMRDITAIQASWLEELASNFYHKTHSYL